ncbi:hypothetical protein H0I76_06725 [Limibaculum sp. M0105]|uniref:Uncharacterized protein n=1 Tax=Thermohalobaculum xanthum TaxID=2753746 RepID=A0A8J7M5I2_9RHOB|nr:hypothetical protein [Thermohalobaculum xanthum]MBK0398876.1 hypothetical protein [Thermohalobaculum xanthum]
MISWLIAFSAIAVLGAFLATIGAFVPEPDLLLVLLATVLFAVVDFLRDFRKGDTNGK